MLWALGVESEDNRVGEKAGEFRKIVESNIYFEEAWIPGLGIIFGEIL